MKKLGIIGLGNMGSAILDGVLRKKIFKPGSIYVNDIDKKKILKYQRLSVKALNYNSDIANSSDIIILAMKPQDIKSVLSKIRPYLNRTKVLISIAAGITTSFIEKNIGTNIKVVRVMPNMPFLVGEGMSVLAKGKYADQKALKTAENIFMSSGKTLILSENKIDAVTALSGSGPAYIFLMVNACIKAAIKLGLNRSDATKLAVMTAGGSAKLLIDSGLDPQFLIEKIASKGGTTEAALKVFNSSSFDDIVFNALKAASVRSRELGKILSNS